MKVHRFDLLSWPTEPFVRRMRLVKKSLYSGVVIGVAIALSSCVYLKVLGVRNQAEQLYKEGRMAEIIPLVEKTMAEVEEELGPDHRYMGEAYNGLAILYAYSLNDFERAQEYFQRALRIRTTTLGPEHPDTIETINLMGFLYHVTGDFSRAEASFKKALALRTKVLGPDHPDTADSQVYLAGLYMNEGRYGEAEVLLRQSLENEAQAVSTRYPSPADSHAYLGALYSNMGDDERAERYHRQALKIRERELGPDHPIVASSLDSLAFLYRDKGDFQTAEQYAKRSLRIKEKAFGRYHGFTGDSLLSLGILQERRQHYQPAADYFQQALDVYRTVLSPENYRILLAKALLAGLSLKTDDLAAARRLCEEVLASPGIAQVKELLWNTQVLYSLVLAKSGNPNAAIFFGKEAVNAIQRVRSSITGLDSAMQKGFVMKRGLAFRYLAALLMEQGRVPEAQQVLTMLKEEEHFDFIRRDARRGDVRKTQADYTPVEEPWLQRYRVINERLSAIGREYGVLKQQKRRGLSDRQKTQLKQLREDLAVAKHAFRRFLDELDDELQQVSRMRAIEIAQKNLDKLKAVQGTLRALGQGVVLIHYLITDDKLYAIVTTDRVQIVRTVKIDRTDLNRKVYLLRERLQDPRQDPRQLSQALYDLLLAPIIDDLRQADARTLMFSMDGTLRYIPVAALYDGAHYMAEDFQIILFTEAAQTKLNTSPSAEWSLAGLGVTQAVGDFSELPSVGAELESIVRKDAGDRDGVLPGVILLDEAFTEEAVQDVLEEGYPVLHIASHFVFQPGTERNSYLVLGDGTHLSLARILDLDLDFNSVELLTLSACETAVGGADADGREIEGFGWLAQRQGAQAVLATLWPVADRSTAEFMLNLYSSRQSEGLTKAAALQRTQIQFIRSQSYAHPFFWAPFILMGNWL
jgi:CHAT domain-containing protein/Flp pilus assembly protein TadD